MSALKWVALEVIRVGKFTSQKINLQLWLITVESYQNQPRYVRIIPWEVRETLYSMLSQRQKDILIGTMLGDGHLEQNGKNVRLRVGHGLPQRGYVLWKYRELKDLVRGSIRTAKTFHSKKNKYYKHLQFSTLTCNDFTEWRDIFYHGGKKIVPKNISEILTSPLSLAVWHMDDGYKRNDCNALRLNTDAFAVNEQELLTDCLKINFGIESKLHKKDKTFNIYIGGISARRFCELIRPHIIDSLLYKVSLTP